jgi:hypothetical protein
MTLLIDDYKDLKLPSDPFGALPATEDRSVLEDTPATAPEPVHETIVEARPLPDTENLALSFERDADEIVRMAAASNAAATVEDLCAGAAETYETVSQTLRTSSEELTTAFTQLNWKLFEFARMNAEANLNFVRQVAGVRNVRDLVDVQTAYMRGQYDALTSQLRELQTLTTEIAGKTTAPLQHQLTHATQLPWIR